MSANELESMLAALRERSRGVEAPRRVEEALRGAFRARAKRRPRWPLALAAAVALLIGAAAWMGRSKPQVEAVVHPAPKPAAAPVVVPRAPVAAAQTAPRPVRRKAKRVVPQEPPEEIATEFLPLEETTNLAPIESGQVVRMQLPRSTMIRFGLPVNPDRMLEPVNADVVFAQDGIARAIRFVK